MLLKIAEYKDHFGKIRLDMKKIEICTQVLRTRTS